MIYKQKKLFDELYKIVYEKVMIYISVSEYWFISCI